MHNSRMIAFLGAVLVFLLLCVGLGWGPAAAASHPERIALLGLAVLGLVWPALMLRLAVRYQAGSTRR